MDGTAIIARLVAPAISANEHVRRLWSAFCQVQLRNSSEVDLNLGLLIGQLSVLDAALQQVVQSIGFISYQGEHLLTGLRTMIKGCDTLVAKLNLSSSAFTEELCGHTTIRSERVRYAWDDDEIEHYVSRLSKLILAFNVLLRGLRRNSRKRTESLLSRSESRNIFQQVEKDILSLNPEEAKARELTETRAPSCEHFAVPTKDFDSDSEALSPPKEPDTVEKSRREAETFITNTYEALYQVSSTATSHDACQFEPKKAFSEQTEDAATQPKEICKVERIPFPKYSSRLWPREKEPKESRLFPKYSFPLYRTDTKEECTDSTPLPRPDSPSSTGSVILTPTSSAFDDDDDADDDVDLTMMHVSGHLPAPQEPPRPSRPLSPTPFLQSLPRETNSFYTDPPDPIAGPGIWQEYFTLLERDQERRMDVEHLEDKLSRVEDELSHERRLREVLERIVANDTEARAKMISSRPGKGGHVSRGPYEALQNESE